MAVNPTKYGEHEFCILLQLHEKVTLTSSHILKVCFVGRTISCVHKVLGKMKKQHLIEAVSYCLGQQGKLEDVYLMTKEGWKALVSVNLLDEQNCPHRIKKPPKLLADYVHRMAIIHYWIDLEMDIMRDSKFELSLFVPEYKHLRNGKTITLKYEVEPGEFWQVRNDALFIITDVLAEREYLFLLEIDRGTMPIKVSKKMRVILNQQPVIRNSLEGKLLKIQQLLSVSGKVFPSLGHRFNDFGGARVVVITSSAKRVVNIIHKIPLHPELLRQEVFMFSYFDETSCGAFGCNYAVAITQNGEQSIGSKSIRCVLS